MVFRLTASRATLLSAMRLLVHGRPGTALRFALRYTPPFITVFDMFGLTLLLVGVTGFITSRHDHLLCDFRQNVGWRHLFHRVDVDFGDEGRKSAALNAR